MEFHIPPCTLGVCLIQKPYGTLRTAVCQNCLNIVVPTQNCLSIVVPTQFKQSVAEKLECMELKL